MKSTKFLRWLLIGLGCCCIIAAAALSLHNIQTSARAADEAQRLTQSLMQQMQAAGTDNSTGVDPGLEDSAVDVHSAEQLELINIAGYDICGSVSIPAIDIELAVISDWTYEALNDTACRYAGTYTDHFILMAHNYRRHFGSIKNLVAGDAVTFTTPGGRVYNYEVTAVEIWSKYELDEIVSGSDWNLTLFTCTYGGENRVVVRCSLVET